MPVAAVGRAHFNGSKHRITLVEGAVLSDPREGADAASNTGACGQELMRAPG